MRSHEWIKSISWPKHNVSILSSPLYICGEQQAKVQLVSSGCASSLIVLIIIIIMLDWTDNRTPLFMAVPMYSDTQRNTLRNAWGWHMWKPTKILLWSLTYSRKNGQMLSQGELCRQYIWLLCVSTYVCVCLLQLLCDECWGIRDERAPLDGVNTWFIAAAASQPHIDLATL